MKIKNKDNRHAKTYDLSRMQDCDNCCSSWPSRDGVVDFRGEKIYFIEYQDLTKPKDVREVRVMGFSVKFNPQEVREYIPMQQEDLTSEERSELIAKIAASGFGGRILFPEER